MVETGVEALAGVTQRPAKMAIKMNANPARKQEMVFIAVDGNL
jgi:hypothetical protein